jgi:hypothetical protein
MFTPLWDWTLELSYGYWRCWATAKGAGHVRKRRVRNWKTGGDFMRRWGFRPMLLYCSNLHNIASFYRQIEKGQFTLEFLDPSCHNSVEGKKRRGSSAGLNSE